MQSETEGITKLRRGVLMFMFVPLLLGTVFFVKLIPLFTFNATELLDVLMIMILLAVVSVILGILGISNIREGFEILKKLGKISGTGYAGATLYLISLLLLLAGTILLIIVVGIFIILLGAVLMFIANILVGAGFYNVGDTYNEDLTKVGGILVIIPLGFVSFIGYVLVYIGLGKIKIIPEFRPYRSPDGGE